MALSDVHAWLQVRKPYEQGVLLLQEHGDPDETLMFLLELGETTVSRDRLTVALQELVERAASEQAARRPRSQELITKQEIVAEREQLARSPRSDGFQDVQLPEALATLRETAKGHLKEMSYLQSRLELLPSDRDRLRDALRIVELDELIASSYARLDSWKATGRDPGEAPPAPPKNGAELQKELGTIRSYLSKVSKGKLKASPEKVRQREERLAEVIRLIDAL